MRKGIRMQDLLHPETLAAKVASIVEWKNLLVEKGYGQPAISAEGMTEWLHKFGDRLVPYICDTTVYLLEALKENKNILFEAQLGALRDIDYGIYPYTSSSTTLAAFAPIGAGIPGARLDEVVGITKAYSSAVGGGPFTCELFGEEGDAFDPEIHEAVQDLSSGGEQVVGTVLRRGYRVGDKLVRNAMVIIADPEPSAEQES